MLFIVFAINFFANIGNLVLQKITVNKYKSLRHIYIKFFLSFLVLFLLNLLGIIKLSFLNVDTVYHYFFIFAASHFLIMYLFNLILEKYPAHFVYVMLNFKIIILLFIDAYKGDVNLSIGIILATVAALFGMYFLQKNNDKKKNFDSHFIVKMVIIILIIIVIDYAIQYGLRTEVFQPLEFVFYNYLFITLLAFLFVKNKKIKISEVKDYSWQVIANVFLNITNVYILGISVFLANLIALIALVFISHLTIIIMKEKVTKTNYFGLGVVILAFVYIAFLLNILH